MFNWHLMLLRRVPKAPKGLEGSSSPPQHHALRGGHFHKYCFDIKLTQIVYIHTNTCEKAIFYILKRDSKKKRAKTERKWEKLKKNYIKNTNLKPPSFMHSKSTFICSNELYL